MGLSMFDELNCDSDSEFKADMKKAIINLDSRIKGLEIKNANQETEGL